MDPNPVLIWTGLGFQVRVVEIFQLFPLPAGLSFQVRVVEICQLFSLASGEIARHVREVQE